jgi:uncharacterized protein (TIGR02452 family)
MSKRTTRAQTARQTLTILEEGAYLHPSGKRISLRDELASAHLRSVLYAPDDFRAVFRQRDQRLRDRPPTPIAFEVVKETTLHAARRLAQGEPGARVLALNFASARHPGGGFLKGSQAQEQSLARASGLYGCIAPFRQMYYANARMSRALRDQPCGRRLPGPRWLRSEQAGLGQATCDQSRSSMSPSLVRRWPQHPNRA